MLNFHIYSNQGYCWLLGKLCVVSSMNMFIFHIVNTREIKNKINIREASWKFYVFNCICIMKKIYSLYSHTIHKPFTQSYNHLTKTKQLWSNAHTFIEKHRTYCSVSFLCVNQFASSICFIQKKFNGNLHSTGINNNSPFLHAILNIIYSKH